MLQQPDHIRRRGIQPRPGLLKGILQLGDSAGQFLDYFRAVVVNRECTFLRAFHHQQVRIGTQHLQLRLSQIAVFVVGPSHAVDQAGTTEAVALGFDDRPHGR
ncbi:hypothetical protein NWF32_31265 [Pseudomonas qingdaonensis]|nr:hypothetical protein [Pseudomonas qingdaonensis]